MIEVTSISKSFELSKKQRKERDTKEKSTLAVDHISFQCKPGKVFSLLGPNGAGKTTTLRMLAGIIKPSSGTININNINILEKGIEAKKHIGFLTGSTGLYERLTCDEVIDYFGKLYHVENQLIQERKEKLYSLLDMHKFKSQRIGKLSTGMKQKVSIVRTMIHDPSVVIFDEPTSGLDVITAEHIIELIQNCKNEGKTVIFSSHIMSEVDLLCDDLAIIDNGKIIFNNTMEVFRETMEAENITAEFIRIINQNRAS